MTFWRQHPETVEVIERAKAVRQELLDTVARLDEFVSALNAASAQAEEGHEGDTSDRK